MKKQIILAVLLIFTISCHSNNFNLENKLNDSVVYFSIKSVCNIQIKLLDKSIVLLNLNGKSNRGIVSKSRENEGFYEIKNENKFILGYTFDENDILIVNQQYQFGCESAKVIRLNKLIDDFNMLKEFKIYEKDTFYIYDDLDLINDKAYYLEKMKCYKTSEYILKKILLIKPNRIVAWLNLADVSWKQNKFDIAKTNYKKYISLMVTLGKDLKKIPKRVYDRSK